MAGVGGQCNTEEVFLVPTQQPPSLKHGSAVLSSYPPNAKQWISQMQLEVTSRAKYYKKVSSGQIQVPNTVW